MATPSPARRAAAIAGEQFDEFHMRHESDPPSEKQIRRYWTGLA